MRTVGFSHVISILSRWQFLMSRPTGCTVCVLFKPNKTILGFYRMKGCHMVFRKTLCTTIIRARSSIRRSRAGEFIPWGVLVYKKGKRTDRVLAKLSTYRIGDLKCNRKRYCVFSITKHKVHAVEWNMMNCQLKIPDIQLTGCTMRILSNLLRQFSVSIGWETVTWYCPKTSRCTAISNEHLRINSAIYNTTVSFLKWKTPYHQYLTIRLRYLDSVLWIPHSVFQQIKTQKTTWSSGRERLIFIHWFIGDNRFTYRLIFVW